MAQGSKWSDDVKDKAKVLLATNMSIPKTALQLNVPESTIKTWKVEWDNDGSLTELRQRKKSEWEDLFISEAQDVIRLATARVKATIKEASPAQAATIAGIYTDKMRLIQGETTSNVGQAGLTIQIGNQVVTNNNTENPSNPA
jgi:hypothetical protein